MRNFLKCFCERLLEHTPYDYSYVHRTVPLWWFTQIDPQQAVSKILISRQWLRQWDLVAEIRDPWQHQARHVAPNELIWTGCEVFLNICINMWIIWNINVRGQQRSIWTHEWTLEKVSKFFRQKMSRPIHTHMCVCLYVYICVYIYAAHSEGSLTYTIRSSNRVCFF